MNNSKFDDKKSKFDNKFDNNSKFKFRKKKKCPFCKDEVQYFDYKDIQNLEKFINEKGKIAPRRSSGCCAKHQRKIAEAIKKARNIALLPFTCG